MTEAIARGPSESDIAQSTTSATLRGGKPDPNPLLDISNMQLNDMFMGKSIGTAIINDINSALTAKSVTRDASHVEMVRFNEIKELFGLATLKSTLWSAKGKIVYKKGTKTEIASAEYVLSETVKGTVKVHKSRWVSYNFEELTHFMPCSMVIDKVLTPEADPEKKRVFVENVLYVCIIRWLFGFAGLTWDTIYVDHAHVNVTSFWEITQNVDAECFKSLMTKAYIHNISDNLIPAIHKVEKIIKERKEDIEVTNWVKKTG